LLAAVLALASCSTTSQPKGEATMTTTFQEGVPGGVMVGTHQETATVTAIDAAGRKVTLVSPDGSKTVFRAGPEVINFDQIRVGDQVKATVVEQLVVFLREDGMPPSDGQAAVVALAPKGAKPGVLMANTVEVTAEVKSIDLNRHKATLQFPDGKSKTFAVRPDVDLTKVKLGQEVVICVTEALAIVVEKP
jgi:translation elongation factor P/translation initiation factor 5A